MKFILIAAVSILSALATGLTLPDLTRRATILRPQWISVVKEDFPDTLILTNISEVSRTNGAHAVETYFGLVLPPCTGVCTINFSGAFAATGSRRIQLLTTLRLPVPVDTWNTKPLLDNYLGTFLVPPTGTGQATLVEGPGLPITCRANDTRYGFAAVPVWDNDYVIWDLTWEGFFITCG